MSISLLQPPYAFNSHEVSVASLAKDMKHVSPSTIAHIQKWHTSITEKIDQFSKSNQLFEDAFRAAVTHCSPMTEDIRRDIYNDRTKVTAEVKSKELQYVRLNKSPDEYDSYWRSTMSLDWGYAGTIITQLPMVWKDYFRLRFLENQTS
jgi:hypothetical protein